MTRQETSSGGIPRIVLIPAVLLAGAAMLFHLAGDPGVFLAKVLVALSDGGLAALIVAAAGGYGYLIVRALAPPTAPIALRVLTSCGAGFWLLSTGVLLAGTLASGMLSRWLWWPIVGTGLILAAWQGRRWMEPGRRGRRFGGQALIWVIFAVALALWLAGATRPPGWIGGTQADAYDVLEYHLQIPREYYNAGQIQPLRHNVYSHYPLGVEMLFLLGMILRGGAYEGMYLAKFLHGGFGILTVGAIFSAAQLGRRRALFSAALLGTAPIAIYLGWLAMVELAEVFYLCLAVLWLREWISRESGRSCLLTGAMLGAGCAVKYLSVGFVVLPVLAVATRSFRWRRKRSAAATGRPNPSSGGWTAMLRISARPCPLRWGGKCPTNPVASRCCLGI